MGFWGTLGKLALPIASVAAAPFTGGTSLLGLAGVGGKAANIIGGVANAAKTVGPVLSGQAKGSADQRISEAPEIRGAYNSNLAGTQLGDKRAILASLLGGASDASIGRPAGSTIPTFGITGGLRPSAFSDKAGLLSRLQTPIKPLEMPTAGKLEKGLGIAGMAGQILGALPKFGGGTPPYVADKANPAAGVPQMPWTLPQQTPQNAGGGYMPGLGSLNPFDRAFTGPGGPLSGASGFVEPKPGTPRVPWAMY